MSRTMFKTVVLSLLMGVTVSGNCNIQAKPDENKNGFKDSLSLLDCSKLEAVKNKLEAPEYANVYSDLVKSANKQLEDKALSVVQKTQIPPSGDKHDYISYGPYWWPNPDKLDGLPWIRKDGQINPLTREGNTDFESKNVMFGNITNLSLAYFFSDEEKYGKKALEFLKVWFVNNETKMNPNLNFAQGIPGINTGRGIGIIEFAGVTNIITAIEILELKNTIDKETSKQLRLWFTKYLYWLQTSENGIFEKNTKNNHGVWYDVQEVSILMFLNKNEEAKAVLETVKTKRIATQIEPNGSQPHELARTKALSYSTMNLRGFTQLAYFGKRLGVDLWNYQAKNGASIKKAFEFLKPYALEEKKWEHQQISSVKKALQGLNSLFLMAGSQFNVGEYCAIGKPKDGVYSNLLYHCN
ncbi:alginate lyase family protein [Algibacter lectus]|uniref:Alginate lyase n=1 Tax=Algibacter lectus TaxID=221126 RepID=A0A4R8MJJ2_9FLAO|nr:alginate lyase family protein [Algibacter lectus]MWW23186.1 hypothetical protein [Algibacter lectus]TDY64135.1 alginate lyase [Algibacter lectus]